MFYASIEICHHCPVFGNSATDGNDEGQALVDNEKDKKIHCRGQEFHFSEVLVEAEKVGGAKTISPSGEEETRRQGPVIITAERPGAKPKASGYSYRNTFASYLHIFFSSKVNGNGETMGSLADDFVCSAIRNSPR